MARQHHHSRRRSWAPNNGPITIRVGTRRVLRRHHEIQVTGPKDAGRFARLVADQTRLHPREQLIISINGHQPWLEGILSSCLEDFWDHINEVTASSNLLGPRDFLSGLLDVDAQQRGLSLWIR